MIYYFIGFAIDDLLVEGFKDYFTIWNIKANTVKHCGVGEAFSMTISHDKQYIATITDSKLALWNIEGQKMWQIESLKDQFRSLVFSEDSQKILYCDKGILKSTNVNGESRETETMVESVPYSDKMQWALDGKLLIFTNCHNKVEDSVPTLKLWDLNLMSLRKIGKQSLFYGDQIISIGDECVKLIDPTSYSGAPTPINGSNVRRISLSNDSSFIAVNFKKKKSYSFEIYSLPSCAIAHRKQSGRFLCFSNDSGKICFTSKHFRNSILIMETNLSKRALLVPVYGGSLAQAVSRIFAACFSIDEKYLFYGTDKGCQLYDFTTKETHCIVNETRFGTFWHAMHIKVSSEHALISARFHAPKLYSLKTKRVLLEFKVKTRWAIFSPQDETVVILGLRNKTEVQWWDINGRLLLRFHLLEIPYSVSVSSSANCILVSDRHQHGSPFPQQYEKQIEELPYTKGSDDHEHRHGKHVSEDDSSGPMNMLREMLLLFNKLTAEETKTQEQLQQEKEERALRAVATAWKSQYRAKSDNQTAVEVEVDTNIRDLNISNASNSEVNDDVLEETLLDQLKPLTDALLRVYLDISHGEEGEIEDKEDKEDRDKIEKKAGRLLDFTQIESSGTGVSRMIKLLIEFKHRFRAEDFGLVYL